MRLIHSGKVRDLYCDDNGDLILAATDRISVFDVVLPTLIPDKGKILTQLSAWWCARLDDVVPNHIISNVDVPAEFVGRALRCRRLDMVPIECIARGYLAGSGLNEYQQIGAISGVRLPGGLVEGSQLPEPIFTPTTKAPRGEHDSAITFDDVIAQVGAEQAEQLRTITLETYRRGAELAAQRGVIVADTKIELGLDSDGSLVLADEVLTPDSSRFWPIESWQPGRAQPSFDKQFARDWAIRIGWDKQQPAPEMPADVVAATRTRYIAAYEQITGERWE